MKDGNDRTSNSTNSIEALGAARSSHEPAGSAGRGHLTIEFGPREFHHFLEDTDWSDAQKTEYASLVWNIVCEFVAMGFGVHPVQLAQVSGGKPGGIRTEGTGSPAEVVDSSHGKLIEAFMRSDVVARHQNGKESSE